MRARRAFVLLEAVIALAIVGIASTAMLAAIAGEMRTAAHLRELLRAQALGEQRLALVELLPADALLRLPDSVARGRFPAPFADYRWSASSMSARGVPGLFDLEVRITWPDGDLRLATRAYRVPGGGP